MRRTRKAAFWTLAGVLALAISGQTYQSCSARRERAQFLATEGTQGTLIDVGGGRRLHLVCIGQGQPTVIFEPSSRGGASSASVARMEISHHARVCSYDRMGTRGSDPGPDALSVGMLTDDLERMLAAAHIEPPYIVVPASIGGLTGELFARRHPDQVVGVVFLDTALSIQVEHMASALGRFTRRTLTAVACVAPVASQIPCRFARGFEQTARDFAVAPPLRADLPMVVLTAENTKNIAPPGFGGLAGWLWRKRVVWHQEFARRSTRGTWRMVPGSDHLIGNSRPQAVVDAVRELIQVTSDK